jgi:hypothetical protein
MLCRNSPLRRLSFFMLSADANANDFLQKRHRVTAKV